MFGYKKKTRIISWIKSIFFILGFVPQFIFLTVLFKPKWYKEGIWEPVTQIHDGFYALEKNSVDVFFVGSSQVFADINPLLIWHNFGITSYDMTSSAQRLWISKYYIEEIIKYQKPKVIALEMGESFDVTPNDENRNRKALDYMRLSVGKLNAIANSIDGSPSESFLSYVFPIIRYHKRWSSLSMEDFRYFITDKDFFLKGFSPRYNIEPFSPDRWKYNEKQGIFLPLRNKEYLDEIVSICKDNQVELILFRSPSTLWSIAEHECVEQYAEFNQLVFLDYNLLTDEIGLKDTDFNDWNHLNINGADKVSLYFGTYLNEHYDLSDYRSDNHWRNDYKMFNEYDLENRAVNSLPFS